MRRQQKRAGMDIHVLCSLLVFVTQFDAGSLLTMLTNRQQHVVDIGGTVNLECKFYTEHFNLFDNPVIWQKEQRDEHTQINIMGNINPPFGPTKRFRVTFSDNIPNYKFDLSLTRLTLEDSGNYTCEVRGPHSTNLGYVTHYIFVKAPVQSILLTKENETNPDEEIDLLSGEREMVFTENEPSTVRCVAHGGYPPPDVDIFVGRREVTGTFGLSHSTKLIGEKGMRLMEYTTERSTHDFMARARDNGRKLKCRVTVPGLQETNTTSVRMSVHYSPIVECHGSEAFLGDRNVYLECTVKARPAVTALFWIIDENGTTVSEGEVIDEYWTLINHGEEVTIKLFMRETKPRSFKAYRLVAENAVDVKTQEVILHQKFRTTPRPASTSKQGHSGASVSKGTKGSGYQHITSGSPTISPPLGCRDRAALVIVIVMLTFHVTIAR